jgi:hypothetical protein
VALRWKAVFLPVKDVLSLTAVDVPAAVGLASLCLGMKSLMRGFSHDWMMILP